MGSLPVIDLEVSQMREETERKIVVLTIWCIGQPLQSGILRIGNKGSSERRCDACSTLVDIHRFLKKCQFEMFQESVYSAICSTGAQIHRD